MTEQAVILVMNCPTVGILTGAKESFIQNFVTNVVAADYPVNSICLLVHPNRAGQSECRIRGWLVYVLVSQFWI